MLCQKYIENMTKIENYVENKEENMKIKQIIFFVYFSYLEDKSASQYFPLAHVIFVRHLSYVVIREGTCELCSNNCKYLLTMTDMRGHS